MVPAMDPMTPQRALALVAELGGTAWLVRHHELVLEAATLLCDELRRVKVQFDRTQVLVGAALHDIGKIVHPVEMSDAGSEHEAAGRQLLLEHGVPPETARFCVTHAAWDSPDVVLEDLLVALADKLWKGKRVEQLEELVTRTIAQLTKRDVWSVFSRVDAICERIAAGGADRLALSAV